MDRLKTIQNVYTSTLHVAQTCIVSDKDAKLIEVCITQIINFIKAQNFWTALQWAVSMEL
jgi:hypothetical protein